jgi:hypothetical protein
LFEIEYVVAFIQAYFPLGLCFTHNYFFSFLIELWKSEARLPLSYAVPFSTYFLCILRSWDTPLIQVISIIEVAQYKKAFIAFHIFFNVPTYGSVNPPASAGLVSVAKNSKLDSIVILKNQYWFTNSLKDERL